VIGCVRARVVPSKRSMDGAGAEKSRDPRSRVLLWEFRIDSLSP
jgi:hypothetical protein